MSNEAQRPRFEVISLRTFLVGVECALPRRSCSLREPAAQACERLSRRPLQVSTFQIIDCLRPVEVLDRSTVYVFLQSAQLLTLCARASIAFLATSLGLHKLSPAMHSQ